MRVLLLQDVANVGQKGDIKDVSDGHAQNFLIPRGFARFANNSVIATHMHKQKVKQEKREEGIAMLGDKLSSMKNEPIVLKHKANEEGHLFGSVDVKEVVGALKKKGIEVAEKMVHLENTIKNTGMFPVSITVGDTPFEITLEVTSS